MTTDNLVPDCLPGFPLKRHAVNIPPELIEAAQRYQMALRMILKITGNPLVIRYAKDAIEGKDIGDGKRE